jgi:hypothetical protein
MEPELFQTVRLRDAAQTRTIDDSGVVRDCKDFVQKTDTATRDTLSTMIALNHDFRDSDGVLGSVRPI